MDQALLRSLYNRCNPAEPLRPDDARNVDLDAYGSDGHRVRGVNWVTKLARRVELAQGPVCELFTGLPGSGKSTELLRLAERLGAPEGANLLAVVVQAEQVLDLASPVDIPDIIAAIIYQTERAVLTLEGRDPDIALRDGYLTRLWAWLCRTDLEIKTVSAGVQDRATGLSGNLVVEMKTRPTLREQVRRAVSAHLSAFLRDAFEELTRLQTRATDKGRAGVVVLLDSLEKLRGTSASWQAVLESAERVFAGGAPYLRLPVHTLYTVPPAMLSRRVNQVHFLPMLKMHDREGRVFAAGVEAARAIVERRIETRYLASLFGPTRAQARLERVVRWSGGYPREIVRLLQSTVAAWEGGLSEAAFERVFNEVADEYRKVVPASAFEWLGRLAVDRYLTLDGEEQQEAADLMLSNNVVLRYLNDRDWFELHPAVREIPGVREAIARLTDGRAGDDHRSGDGASTP